MNSIGKKSSQLISIIDNDVAKRIAIYFYRTIKYIQENTLDRVPTQMNVSVSNINGDSSLPNFNSLDHLIRKTNLFTYIEPSSNNNTLLGQYTILPFRKNSFKLVRDGYIVYISTISTVGNDRIINIKTPKDLPQTKNRNLAKTKNKKTNSSLSSFADVCSFKISITGIISKFSFEEMEYKDSFKNLIVKNLVLKSGDLDFMAFTLDSNGISVMTADGKLCKVTTDDNEVNIDVVDNDHPALLMFAFMIMLAFETNNNKMNEKASKNANGLTKINSKSSDYTIDFCSEILSKEYNGEVINHNSNGTNNKKSFFQNAINNRKTSKFRQILVEDLIDYVQLNSTGGGKKKYKEK